MVFCACKIYVQYIEIYLLIMSSVFPFGQIWKFLFSNSFHLKWELLSKFCHINVQ